MAMAAKLRLKKGDQVIVTTGPHRGKRGEILDVIKGDRPGDHRVVVGGINKVKRHTRPSPKSPGGIIEKEAPIHISNVAMVDPKENKASRVGYTFLEDGRKVRFARRSGEIIDR
jgi:large subunit ribosomal protein L24